MIGRTTWTQLPEGVQEERTQSCVSVRQLLPGTTDLLAKVNKMKLIGLRDALKASDLDIKMVAGRASRFRVFGSPDRIADHKLVIADLRDSSEPPDLAEHYQVLDRHPMAAILLLRKLEA